MVNITRWWNSGLHKDIQQKLKNRVYSLNEIEGVYHIVFNLYRARMKPFKHLIILFLFLFIIMLGLNFICIEDKLLAVISCVIPFVISFIAMIYAYFVWVVKEKNQFMKCLSVGYPEFTEKYEHQFEVDVNLMK